MAWGSLGTSEWRALRQVVFERDGHRCRYCGEPPPRVAVYRRGRMTYRSGACVDHIIPRSKGGTDDLTNLVTACQKCNLRKYDNIWEPLALETL